MTLMRYYAKKKKKCVYIHVFSNLLLENLDTLLHVIVWGSNKMCQGKNFQDFLKRGNCF